MLTRFDVAAGTTLRIPFTSYDSNGASVTLTGLAVTDIEIYKDGSVTQRASDNGYALLDTDGIDFDSITGLHAFSVDLADNTTAGFYTVGSDYWVVVSSVTIDTRTVNFIAAWFRIVDAVDVSDLHSLLTLVRSDTTHIESDAVAIETIVSDIQSDTNKLVSDATEADASDIISLLLLIRSDTTHIESDAAAVETIVSDIQSDTNKLVSDATEVDTSDILSMLTKVYSDTTAIHSDTTHVESDAVRIESMAVVVKSDTSDIRSALVIIASDTAAIEAAGGSSLTSDQDSKLTRVAAAIVEVDTSDIHSLLTKVYSDTNAINAGEGDLSDILSLATKIYSDTTLATGTNSLPAQGTPGATATEREMIAYLYKAWRNKTTQTSSEYALYAADGTTKDHEAVVSDDGTTTTRGEVTTGA
jgi:hypothetical protein